MTFADKNEKIEKKVVEGYKHLEGNVVGGYKKVEESAIGGFTKVSDHFVDKFFRKDGETLKEAKERLKQADQQERINQEKRMNNYQKYQPSNDQYDSYPKKQREGENDD